MAGVGATVTVELFMDDAWVDITDYVRATESHGIRITFGVQGETGTADPSECSLTVNNADGRFSPRNAEGPYYGLLKRNTPLRVTVGSTVRYVGEVSEFPSRWGLSESEVWVPLTASGVLRRLARYASLQSTLRQFLPTLSTVTGYWPMEDAEGSESFASGLPGGAPMTFIGSPQFASVTPDAAGSGPVSGFDLVEATGVSTGVTPGSTGFTAGMLLTMPDTETANNARLLQVYTAGTAAVWVITYETGGVLRLRAYTEDGAEILNAAADYSLDDGRTGYLKLEVTDDGADVDYALSLTGIGTISGTVTGYQATAPGSVIIGTSQSITGSVGIGHVVLANTATALVSVDFDNYLAAFAGESVEDRFTRICGDIDVTPAVLTNATGDTADSTLLGPQGITDPLTVLRDGETADVGGILRDSLNEMNELVYATRRFRYNSDPVMELDYSNGEVSAPLEPTEDDRLLANDVIATRTGGSSARATDTTSPLSTLNYPDGVGTYQQAVTVNVDADSKLTNVASWLLEQGTLDVPRFPQITLDLVANTGLVSGFDLLRPGHLITVENLPDWASQSTVYLHALGWTETITSHRRTVTLNCTPANVYDVVRLDDSDYGRLDSDTTTLNEALDTTETGVDYTGDTWVTTADHASAFPFDIVVGGEQMTVTSAAAGTFTVTRSVNGVVKTHASGTPVRLARPMRLAL